jgi:hypothetical protein
MDESVRPQRLGQGDERSIPPADLWDKKVAEGMSPGSATAYVSRIHGAPPASTANRFRTAPSPSTPAAAPSHSATDAAALGLSQGLTLGFGDELEAGFDSLVDRLHGKKGTYDERLRESRGLTRAAREAHPVAAGAGEVAGAIGSGLLGGVARPGAGLARAMLEGAAYGGASGAGNAEGDLSDRAKGAAVGAGVGAVAVPLIGAAGRVLKRAGGAALDVTGLRPLGNAATSTAAGPIRTTLRGAISHVPGVETAEERAIGKVAQNLERDGESVTSLRGKLAARHSEKPETVMDLAGDNTRMMGNAVRSQPGPGSQRISRALAERQTGAEERAIGDAVETSGVGSRTNAHATAEQLVDDRAKEAQELYSQAFAHGAVDNPKINELLKLPYFAPAWKQALKLAEAERHQLPSVFKVVKQPSALLDDSGAPMMRDALEATAVPDVKTLHYLKLGLDDVVEAGKRAPLERGGFSPTEAAGVQKILNEYLGELDRAVPAYKTARNAYAGRTRLMEALEHGRNLFKTHPDQIGLVTKDMTDSERELFRKGGVEALADRLESIRPGHDVTAPTQRTLDQRRLRHLFPDADAFSRFKEQLEREAGMLRTNRQVTGGSNTVNKAAALADLAGVDLADMVGSAATGNGAGVVRSLGRKALQSSVARNLTGNTEAVADAASRRLTAGMHDPRELAQLLDELEAYQGRSTVRGNTRRLGGRAIAALAGQSSSP